MKMEFAMTKVDEAYDFIKNVFAVLTERDFYLIVKEYELSDDEAEELKKKLSENGWDMDGKVYYG